MQLFKFELYKIFKQKIIYVAFLLLVLLTSSYVLNFEKPTNSTKELYEKWEGTLTEEKIEKVSIENKKLMTVFEERVKEMDRNNEFGVAYTEEERNKSGLYETIAFIQGAENSIDKRLNELQNENKYNSALEKKLINNIDLSYFSFNKAPREIIDYVNTFSFLITGAMILIGLSTIYTKEYNSGVDNYILSSKKGRKSLVLAKIFASLFYTFLVVITWEACNLISKIMILGNDGWNTPIQYTFKLYFSPYGLNMIDFHLIQLGIHLVAAFGFALLVVLISSICKNSLISLFISGSIFSIPFIIVETLMMPLWLEDAFKFSFIYIMKVEFLFAHFKTINFFGQPVLYPIVAIIIMFMLSLIFVMINLKILKNKEVVS